MEVIKVYIDILYNIQWIDLGLPSNNLWADRDVYADSIEKLGKLYKNNTKLTEALYDHLPNILDLSELYKFGSLSTRDEDGITIIESPKNSIILQIAKYTIPLYVLGRVYTKQYRLRLILKRPG